MGVTFSQMVNCREKINKISIIHDIRHLVKINGLQVLLIKVWSPKLIRWVGAYTTI